MARDESWQLACWNIEQGLHGAGNSTMVAEAGDPLSAVRAAVIGVDGGTSILVLENFHRYLGSAEIVQALSHAVIQGKVNRSFIVILSPMVQLPVELKKLFVTVDHELPTRDQLHEIARGIATETNELPDGRALDDVLDAASGLTRYEAEGAFTVIGMDVLVEANGNLRLVYDESLDLPSIGNVTIRRGSLVEPTADGRWTADLSPVNGPVLRPFAKRGEALAAEVRWMQSYWLISPSD